MNPYLSDSRIFTYLSFILEKPADTYVLLMNRLWRTMNTAFVCLGFKLAKKMCFLSLGFEGLSIKSECQNSWQSIVLLLFGVLSLVMDSVYCLGA